MFFWCLRFPPKNERIQVDLRYHSSKVEFLRSYFGGNWRHRKPFRNYLTFTKVIFIFGDNYVKYLFFFQCNCCLSGLVSVSWFIVSMHKLQKIFQLHLSKEIEIVWIYVCTLHCKFTDFLFTFRFICHLRQNHMFFS